MACQKAETRGQGACGPRALGSLAVALVVGLLLAGFAGTLAAQQPPRPTPAQEGFVPVTDAPPDEQLPAVPLVIAAYAVAWVAIFGYLWFIWQRLSKVEREMAEVRRRIESGAHR